MKRKYSKEQIKNMSFEERYEYSKYVNEYKYNQKKRFQAGMRAVFFPPLSIGFRVVSVICKLLGIITAIGLPYGIYCAYRVALQLYNGVPFGEVEQIQFVFLFLIFPFIAFFAFHITKSLSEYLNQKI